MLRTQSPRGSAAPQPRDRRCGQQSGLVVPTLALLGRKQRNGDDDQLPCRIGLQAQNGRGKQIAQRIRNAAQSLVLQQVNHLAQLVLIDRARDRAFKLRRIVAAFVAEQSFAKHWTRQTRALHVNVECFAADAAQGHILRGRRVATVIADRQRARAQKRKFADAAIGGKSRCYQIIQNRAKRGGQATGKSLWTQHSRANITPSGVATWRRAGRNLERTLIQSVAEDAPHSHGAPGRLGRADARIIDLSVRNPPQRRRHDSNSRWKQFSRKPGMAASKIARRTKTTRDQRESSRIKQNRSVFIDF